jgi:hypothetical protein
LHGPLLEGDERDEPLRTRGQGNRNAVGDDLERVQEPELRTGNCSP